MSIDTGQGLSYNANYPSANQNQSSQQFRDNFAVIKTAIENIQSGTYSNSSIFALSSAVNTSGGFVLTAGFKNNSFTLPVNTTATTAGMIRFNSSTSKVEFYSSSWVPLLNTEANGAVILSGSPVGLIVNNTLTVNKTPVDPTDAANKVYVDNTVVAALTPVVSNIATLSASISTISNGLATEANARLLADNDLQTQINDLRDNAASGSTDAQINALQIQVETLGTNITDLTTRVEVVENSVSILSNTVNTDHATLIQIGDDLATETTNRIANDAAITANVTSLELYVNTIVLNGTANALNVEIATRSAQSATIATDVSNLNSTVTTVNTSVTNLSTDLTLFKTSVIHTFFQSTPPDMSTYPLAAGSLWFDSSSGNSINVYNYDSYLSNSSNIAGYWDLVDTGSGNFYLPLNGGTMYGDIAFSLTNSNTIVMNANASVRFYDSNTGQGAYLDIANCGDVANTKILTTVDGFVDLSNTIVRFPNSNVIVDADHYLLFQGIPNQVGGNDGAGIQFQSTNLDYAYLSATYYNGIVDAIAQEITANASLSVTDARHRVSANAAHMGNSYTNWATITNGGVAPGPNLEFGLMRIFTTNDFENGVNNDSMAIEPAASLYLNPGWSGGGQEQTSPVTRTALKTNARIIVGNAISNVVTIRADTGDIYSAGNLYVNSSVANSGSGYFTNLSVANGTFTLSNSGFFLPQSDITIDANHALLFQSLPNQANGSGDAGYVTYDANNFDYMPAYTDPMGSNTSMSATLASLISTYGTLANADTHAEFSCLRLGTTNDSGGTGVADSMALEPSADLFLNPGWAGIGTDTKSYSGTSGRTRYVNSVTYGGTAPYSNVDTRAYSNIIVGNATVNVMKINALTGNMWTKGNITADGDISGLSDISVKSDLNRISNALDKIASISGYTFTRTDLPNNPVQMGVIAQEVEQIAPELINQLPSGLKAVAYGNFAGMFVEAFKDVKDMLTELKAEVEELKKKI